MNKEKLKLCPCCNKEAEWFDRIANTTCYEYKCSCCGNFQISYLEILIFDQDDEEYRKLRHSAVCENASAI